MGFTHSWLTPLTGYWVQLLILPSISTRGGKSCSLIHRWASHNRSTKATWRIIGAYCGSYFCFSLNIKGPLVQTLPKQCVWLSCDKRGLREASEPGSPMMKADRDENQWKGPRCQQSPKPQSIQSHKRSGGWEVTDPAHMFMMGSRWFMKNCHAPCGLETCLNPGAIKNSCHVFFLQWLIETE